MREPGWDAEDTWALGLLLWWIGFIVLLIGIGGMVAQELGWIS